MASSLILAIILAYLPIFFWIKFFLRIDKEKPEPLFWLFILFLLGIISAPFIYYLQNIFPQETSLIFAAFIEEIFKIFIPFIVLKKNKYFDEAIDGMVYLIAFGLGLAFVENIGVAFKELFLTHSFSSALSFLFLRFLGANLLHALTSAFLGYFFALYLLKRKNLFLFKGLVIATFFHWFFNYFMLHFSFSIFLVMLMIFINLIILIFKWGRFLKAIRQPIKYPF